MAGLTAHYASLRAYKNGDFSGCLLSIDEDLRRSQAEDRQALLFFKANALYHLARHAEAIQVYRTLLGLEGLATPYRLNALLNYGLISLLLDDPELSGHCLAQYRLEADHEAAIARAWQGVVRVMTGDPGGWQDLQAARSMAECELAVSQIAGLCCLKANRASMAAELYGDDPGVSDCRSEYLLIALFYHFQASHLERAQACLDRLGELSSSPEITLARNYFALQMAWNRGDRGPEILHQARELQDLVGDSCPEYMQQIPAFCNTIVMALGTAPTMLVSRRHGIVGDSLPIFSLRRSIDKYAPTELNVLVLGESGTGKELVARALHAASNRASGPFVAVNCFHLGSNLAEAKLFGYRKGAFSGATADTPGFVQKANGGTLFLDEIGELPPETQANLFRFLDNGIFYPLGSANEERASIRVIAATNQDLRDNTDFRQELYHRLSGVVLRLPRLVEREDDLRSLSQYRVTELNSLHGKSKVICEAAILELYKHAFPGNVRELFNVITRAWYNAGHEIRPEHLELLEPVTLRHTASDEWAPDLEREQLDFDELTARYASRLVRDVHDRLGGKVKDTARRLNMSERSVYRWISKPEDDSATGDAASR